MSLNKKQKIILLIGIIVLIISVLIPPRGGFNCGSKSQRYIPIVYAPLWKEIEMITHFAPYYKMTGNHVEELKKVTQINYSALLYQDIIISIIFFGFILLFSDKKKVNVEK